MLRKNDRLAAARTLALALLVAAVPSNAAAGWTLGVFLGGARTRPNTLTLDRPGHSTHATLGPVKYDGHSFESPVYYGYRVGRLVRPHLALEAEFIHLKAYARTGDGVSVSGRIDGLPVDRRLPLSDVVERFSISHGLNLILGNIVWRSARAAPVTFTVRGGAGFAVPHGESTIDGVSQEQYQVSSAAFQGAAGVELRVTHGVGALVEYKLTAAAPEVRVAGGTIGGRFVSHHIAFGLSWQTR